MEAAELVARIAQRPGLWLGYGTAYEAWTVLRGFELGSGGDFLARATAIARASEPDRPNLDLVTLVARQCFPDRDIRQSTQLDRDEAKVVLEQFLRLIESVVG